MAKTTHPKSELENAQAALKGALADHLALVNRIVNAVKVEMPVSALLENLDLAESPTFWAALREANDRGQLCLRTSIEHYLDDAGDHQTRTVYAVGVNRGDGPTKTEMLALEMEQASLQRIVDVILKDIPDEVFKKFEKAQPFIRAIAIADDEHSALADEIDEPWGSDEEYQENEDS